jgi:hypothetical protein
VGQSDRGIGETRNNTGRGARQRAYCGVGGQGRTRVEVETQGTIAAGGARTTDDSSAHGEETGN